MDSITNLTAYAYSNTTPVYLLLTWNYPVSSHNFFSISTPSLGTYFLNSSSFLTPIDTTNQSLKKTVFLPLDSFPSTFNITVTPRSDGSNLSTPIGNGQTITVNKSSLPMFGIGDNTANFNNCADWDGQNGNITTVGTNGGQSAYGTFDQCGNLYEWNDLDGTSMSELGLRGGRFNSTNIPFAISSIGKYFAIPETESDGAGFRIASSNNVYGFIDFVKVGDANNIADTGGDVGKGSVSYEYYIQKYLVTNAEYVEFLNAVASSDPGGLYSSDMSNSTGGILRSGSSGGYSYTARTNYERKPVNTVSWFNCARYVNWLHNNKSTGNQDSGTTEDGAYTLNGINSGNSVAKNAGAKYHIPTENEWYKAAYYKSGGTNAGYWKYATQSDTDPTCVCASSVAGNVGDGIACVASASPTPTLTPTPTPTPSKPPIVGCDHKILNLYIPNSIISPGGTRASSIQLRIGGGTCCSRSNIIDIPIPPPPPPPPPPIPEVCLPAGIDLFGYTAIISYDPTKCEAGHKCNRAIFDFYINDILIGQANLNNNDDGGYRESVFPINYHIISSELTELKLVCALDDGCHNGVGRVVLKDPSNNIVLAVCMPNDIVVAGSFICPCPKVLGPTHNLAENALNTHIQVDSGSRLIISATGTIDIGWPDHAGAYGPDGIPGIGNDPVSGFPYVSLLGRIGESGTVFLVGSSYDSVVNESGELYLFFYDSQPGDNSGFFNACVTQPTTISFTKNNAETNGCNGNQSGFQFPFCLDDCITTDPLGSDITRDGFIFSVSPIVYNPQGDTTYEWLAISYFENCSFPTSPTILTSPCWRPPNLFDSSITDTIRFNNSCRGYYKLWCRVTNNGVVADSDVYFFEHNPVV